jgi:hypothetical protein
MEEVLRFARTYEAFIYLIFGGLALWEIRSFVLAWENVRQAAFGLERESAQQRLNLTALLLVATLLIVMAEFTLVSFVAPGIPGANPLMTPTLDLLATPTYTLPAGTLGAGATSQPATETPVPLTADSNGCIPGKLEITTPKNGDRVSGKVTLIGSVDVPDLGFYKYEVAHPGDAIWLTIQAGRGAKHNEALGDWETGSLTAGDYLLHLVVTDNQGKTIGTCQVQVQVEPPPS